MDMPEDKNKPDKTSAGREIANANLFADDIVFADTEKILFEEDLQERPSGGYDGLMDGNPSDRYSVVKKLNEGGMKAIWEVDDHRTARKVAMALIQEGKIASKDDIDTFLYEARLTANLQHPNIIPIYDIALDENGNPYFTMKALRGRTLDEILKLVRDRDTAATGEFTRTHLLGIFLKVCNAIEYAHSKGVIHLDLKPSNVIVGDYGDVHVLDWGLSTLVTHLSEYEGEPISWHSMDEVPLENGQTLTRYLEGSSKGRERRNVVGGTPGYMAPEQAQGSPSDIDFQTDVYMLGAMLYEILTYCCPITGSTIKETLQKTVRGEVPPATDRAPEQKIPSALAAIVHKAMAVDAAERYATVSALIRDVHQFQDGFATSAENPTFFTHTARLVKRHKMAVGLIAASLLVIATVTTRSFISIKESESIALGALAELQEKNEYIAETAREVAPDYLHLMAREEQNFAFDAAEEALDTCLAFDPSMKLAWLQKGSMLLCQQRFDEALRILTGQHGHPVRKDTSAIRLAEQYKGAGAVPDAELPELVAAFRKNNMAGGLPRVFYHLNHRTFDPETRFPALADALKQLNPKITSLKFSWERASDGGWRIDISGNPDLDDISPLCGLQIYSLNASGIGAPDLRLLTEGGIRELVLSDVQMNYLPDLNQLTGLEALDISGTRIRNIANIVKYPRLRSLNISGIRGLSIAPQLVWCRNLNLLTVSEAFKGDSTIRALANRGVIIIHTDE